MPILFFPRYSKINQFIRSRVGEVQIDEDTAGQVLREFDLELVGKPANLPYGWRGNNVVVHTTEGKKVIRRYRKKWNSSTISFEHSILTELAENNYLAPRLNRTGDLQSLITIHGKNYALFDFIQGRNFSMSYMIPAQRDSMVEKAARSLAELHTRLQGFEPEGQHHLGFKSLTGTRNRDLDWNRKKLDKLVQDSVEIMDSQDKENLQQLVRISEAVITSLAELDNDLISLKPPRVVIHGDFGLHNILFSEKGEAIPMDFELARLEWRLCDFVISFLRLRNKKGQYDLETMQRFLGAYQQVNPISADEWALFPRVWQHTMLYFLIQYWNSYFETYRKSARLDSAMDAYNQYNWAKTNHSLLVDLAQLN